MWPCGPGILLPGNYCCYSYHLQRGKECLVFEDTHPTNCPWALRQREVQLECRACVSLYSGTMGRTWHRWENHSLCMGHCEGPASLSDEKSFRR